MEDLTAFQRDILYLVAELGDPHGLAIRNKLQDYYGTDVNHGRLYPNLDTLVEMGLLEKGIKDRRTNEYKITTRGIREIQSRRQWEEKKLDGVLED